MSSTLGDLREPTSVMEPNWSAWSGKAFLRYSGTVSAPSPLVEPIGTMPRVRATSSWPVDRMTTLLGAAGISVLPLKWTTVRGKTPSAWPEPLPSGMPVGTDEVGATLADEAALEPVFLPEEQAARTGTAAARPAKARMLRRR